ncbi:hypothetical protein HDE_14586 [Halotydeus destructor]|nr:hypothetical protein HDE_14586 [Halotydeus destructor]
MNSPYDFCKDDRDGCRSLICDANGIIVAEMVYRCMICSNILDSISEAKAHYHKDHIDADELDTGHAGADDPLTFPDNDHSVDLNNDSEAESNVSQPLTGSSSLNYSYASTPVAQNFDCQSKTAHSTGRSGSKKSIAGKPLSPSKVNDVKVQTAGTNGTCTIKSGYITCPVCTCTKFYTTLQRRYGQFSCVGCYRFFKEFFVRPKRYVCPTLGSCALDQRTKCKACWIKSCIDAYTVDDGRKDLLYQNRPLQIADGTSTGNRSPLSRASNGSSGVSSAVDNPSPNEMAEQQSNSALPLAMEFKEEDEPLEMKANDSEEAPEEDDSEQRDEGIDNSDHMEEPDPEDEVDHDGDDSSALSPAEACIDYAGDSPMSLIKPKDVKQRSPLRRKTSGRIKNWCCLKCPNCLADDCGKCINCLDRPKFGGPFIRKQRCLYKKCLMKMSAKSTQ